MHAAPNTNPCRICHHDGPVQPVRVRSNVRKYRGETFEIWRCEACQSIHALGEVDLDECYRDYPFFQQTLDLPLRWAYRKLTRRLDRLGFRRDERILDFGCGSGLLVEYLRRQGYDAVGYDPYSPRHGDPEVLQQQYRWLIAQDVIEHAPEPLEMLRQIDGFVQPGGLVLLGTPDADGMDLSKPERYVHSLHQPFHRHIFSLDALRKATRPLGWEVEHVWHTPYTNMPVLSLPLLHYYMRCTDGMIDSLFDKPMRSLRLWLSPEGLWWLLAGYWRCNAADVLVAMRKTSTYHGSMSH